MLDGHAFINYTSLYLNETLQKWGLLEQYEDCKKYVTADKMEEIDQAFDD